MTIATFRVTKWYLLCGVALVTAVSFGLVRYLDVQYPDSLAYPFGGCDSRIRNSMGNQEAMDRIRSALECCRPVIEGNFFGNCRSFIFDNCDLVAHRRCGALAREGI